MIKVLRLGVHIDNRFDGHTNFEPIYGSSTLIVEKAPLDYGTTLGGDGMLRILIDPSHIAVAEELADMLKKEGAPADKIDYVFITHHHLDHSSNMGMFPRAKIFIGDGYITRFKPNYDVYKKLELISLPENFKIIPTPGHTLESNSYLYVENGTRYICAGDAVREDVIREGAPTVQNDKKQYLESLKKVFSLGDVIIPGHGRMIEGELKKELEKLIYS